MSITFRPNVPLASLTHYVYSCGCGDRDVAIEDIDAYQPIHGPQSCDVCDQQAFVLAEYEDDGVPEVNLSNSNAFLALERLGIEPDYCGEFDPVDFMGRAMVANVGREDDGVPSVVDAQPGRATMVDCGLPAGYWADRMGALAEVATYARDKGVAVYWA